MEVLTDGCLVVSQNFDKMIDRRQTDEKLRDQTLFFDGYVFPLFRGHHQRISNKSYF